MRFESLVNTEGIQTFWACDFETTVFESLVNTEGIQTNEAWQAGDVVFESLVNTEGIQTFSLSEEESASLRVLLIRKEFKLVFLE